jgi:hypothetical protein
MEIPDMMMAILRTGIVLSLDPGSSVNNGQSHNPESTSKSLELKISTFSVAEIAIYYIYYLNEYIEMNLFHCIYAKNFKIKYFSMRITNSYL